MENPVTRSIGVVVTRDRALGEQLVLELEVMAWTAVAIDAAETALDMMTVVDVSLVLVDVATAADWGVCRCLVEARRSPVAIVTSFVARDRRYRRCAFAMGIAAYAVKPCSRRRLREMLRRLRRGERGIELVTERKGGR